MGTGAHAPSLAHQLPLPPQGLMLPRVSQQSSVHSDDPSPTDRPGQITPLNEAEGTDGRAEGQARSCTGSHGACRPPGPSPAPRQPTQKGGRGWMSRARPERAGQRPPPSRAPSSPTAGYSLEAHNVDFLLCPFSRPLSQHVQSPTRTTPPEGRVCGPRTQHKANAWGSTRQFIEGRMGSEAQQGQTEAPSGPAEGKRLSKGPEPFLVRLRGPAGCGSPSQALGWGSGCPEVPRSRASTGVCRQDSLDVASEDWLGHTVPGSLRQRSHGVSWCWAGRAHLGRGSGQGCLLLGVRRPVTSGHPSTLPGCCCLIWVHSL